MIYRNDNKSNLNHNIDCHVTTTENQLFSR